MTVGATPLAPTPLAPTPRTCLLDTSVVATWLTSESGGEAAACHRLFDAMEDGRIQGCVLDLTRYEIANVLVVGKRYDAARAQSAFELLAAVTDLLVPDTREWRLTLQLAADHGLTSYDAAYAAMARSRGLPLVTLDRQLLDAGLGLAPSRLLD